MELSRESSCVLQSCIRNFGTGQIQFRVLTILAMIISSFLLEIKDFYDRNGKFAELSRKFLQRKVRSHGVVATMFFFLVF